MNRSEGIGLSGVPGGGGGLYGRVIDIIMDANHPEYPNKGASSSLYGIFFRELSRPYNESRDSKTDFAYCQTDSISRIPLLGEIVKIEAQPNEDRDKNSRSTKLFWTKVVNMWNHPNHSASPLGSVEENDFGEYFKESIEVNPLQAFPGDVIMQGRHGNTIRLGGTNFDSNIFSEESNNGKPYAIIKVGQEPLEPHFDPTVEDINKDKSSIYLTSDHTLELEEATTKGQGYKKGDEPELANSYKGAQVVINSDRLFFNAREESALIAAKETISISSEKVAIDGEDYIGLDAKKIYLGVGSQQESEPALKGETTKMWLEGLVLTLKTTAQTLAAAPPVGTPYAIAASAAFGALAVALETQANAIPFLKSKKVFIDKL